MSGKWVELGASEYISDSHVWVQLLPLIDNKVKCSECGVVRPITELSSGNKCNSKLYRVQGTHMYIPGEYKLHASIS